MVEKADTDLTQKEISILGILSLILSVYVLGQLLIEAFLPLSEEITRLFQYADFVVCGVFFLDFVGNFRAAPSKLKFMKWGWIDLLTCIPMTNWLALGRFARIFRLIRTIRVLRSTERILQLFLKSRFQNTALVASTIAALLLLTCSASILSLEKEVKDSNIKTTSDALWWGIATMTTVRYGDKYPVSDEGRIVAAILMISGVGLFGTFTGLVSAFLLSPKNKEQEATLEDILVEVKALRVALEKK
jgi:voltage-gated potassium channel